MPNLAPLVQLLGWFRHENVQSRTRRDRNERRLRGMSNMDDGDGNLSRRSVLAGAGVAAGTLAMASQAAQSVAGESRDESLLEDIRSCSISRPAPK